LRCRAADGPSAAGEGFGHVHFHVIPRHAGLDRERRGPGIFALMDGDPARRVPDGDMDQLARRLAAALTAG
jgi:diadenosine tetraphosphate (Ap4A) HIT family hydrolase